MWGTILLGYIKSHNKPIKSIRFSCIFVCAMVVGWSLSGNSVASTWSHSVNDSGVCLIENEKIDSWPFVVIGLSSDNVEIAVYNPSWKSLDAGVSYDLEWEFSENDVWEMSFNGTETDNSVVLKGTYTYEAGHKFLADFIKFDAYKIRYNNRVIAEQTLAGSMKSYYQAMECFREKDPFSNTDSEKSENRRFLEKDPFST